MLLTEYQFTYFTYNLIFLQMHQTFCTNQERRRKTSDGCASVKSPKIDQNGMQWESFVQLVDYNRPMMIRYTYYELFLTKIAVCQQSLQLFSDSMRGCGEVFHSRGSTFRDVVTSFYQSFHCLCYLTSC